MISAFPKIFALGDPKIVGLFDGPVEVTEKVDGSQFVFGRVDGELVMRSKGRQLYRETTDKLFAPAIAHVLSIEHALPDNTVFYTETLWAPRHSTLHYDRVPKNNIAAFGCMDAKTQRLVPVDDFKAMASCLCIDTVPVLYKGIVSSPDKLMAFLDGVSYLGGQKIEGFVVKNYGKELFLGGSVFYVLSGKYVSEAFKEVNKKNWRKDNTGKGRFEVLCENYKTPARWNKAILHLDERGELERSPRDIGKLIKEVHSDIAEEEKDKIKDQLWAMFSKDVLRTAVNGLPEYYKQRLAESALEGQQA